MPREGPSSSPGPGRRRRRPAPIPSADLALTRLLRPLVRPQLWLVRAPRGVPRRPEQLLSHVGGRPYAEGAADWPDCTACDEPLTFLGELALPGPAELPGAAPPLARLATAFVCPECVPELGASEPPGRYAVWLADDPSRANGRVLVPPEDEPNPVHPCSLRPAPGRSLPGGAELKSLSPEAAERLAALDRAIVDETFRGLVGAPFHGTVASGHAPDLGDGADPTPECPSCGKPQAFLGALDGPDLEREDEEGEPAFGEEALFLLYTCRTHPGAARLVAHAVVPPEPEERD